MLEDVWRYCFRVKRTLRMCDVRALDKCLSRLTHPSLPQLQTPPFVRPAITLSQILVTNKNHISCLWNRYWHKNVADGMLYDRLSLQKHLWRGSWGLVGDPRRVRFRSSLTTFQSQIQRIKDHAAGSHPWWLFPLSMLHLHIASFFSSRLGKDQVWTIHI